MKTVLDGGGMLLNHGCVIACAMMSVVSPAVAQDVPKRAAIAVLYFDYFGKNKDLTVLQKGLTQMLISDLTQGLPGQVNAPGQRRERTGDTLQPENVPGNSPDARHVSVRCLRPLRSQPCPGNRPAASGSIDTGIGEKLAGRKGP